LTELSEEKDQLQVCNNAIDNLEQAIPEGKQIIKANEDNLASFISIQSRLADIKLVTQKKMKNESSTKSLYNDFRSCSEKPVIRITDIIDEQIDALRKDVRTLWDKVRQLEMELSGWKSSKRLSENAIKRLTESHSGIEVDLKAGKEAFRPIWRVPSDAWVKIFGYAVQEVKEGYLKTNNNYGMRPPLFNLSQVCQRWRYLVQNDPKLWTFAYVAPTQVWRQDEQDLVSNSAKKSNSSVTVITNLSQYFYNGYYYNQRYNRSGYVQSAVYPDANTLFNTKEYTLLVDTHDDNSTYMQRLSYLPLRTPASLILSSRNSIQYGYLFSYISNFSTVKSFSIINDSPSLFPNTTISSYFPQLREFAIQVKTFPPNFYLNNYLPATLQELRLRNDNGGTMPIISADIELPHLRVLEITFPGTYLLDRFTAKALRSLTFFGPHDYRGTQISTSAKAIEIYAQLLHLKFEDWKNSDTTDGSLGASAVFRDLVERTPLLRTITFAASYVDGGALVSTVETIMSDSGDSDKRRRLDQITLSYPTGIKKDHCEALTKLVKTVKVHV
jgi:hypothetical protein